MTSFFNVEGRRNSFLHRMTPEVRLVTLLSFVVITVSISNVISLVLALLFGIILTIIAGIRGRSLARRMMAVIAMGGAVILLLPLVTPGMSLGSFKLMGVVLTVSREGLEKAVVFSLRMLTALLILNLLVATSGWNVVLYTLRRLGVPSLLVQVVEFTIRYYFVLYDEVQRMILAARARNFFRGCGLWHFRTLSVLGNQIGTLFLRAYGRSERIYLAMLARGVGEPGSKYRQGYREKDRLSFYQSLAYSAFILGVAVGLQLAALYHCWDITREKWGTLEWLTLSLK